MSDARDDSWWDKKSIYYNFLEITSNTVFFIYFIIYFLLENWENVSKAVL